jgi:cytochrome c-type biogenesis protein CcmE
MEQRMRKKRFLIGAVVIAVAVSYLVYAGIRETSVYYLTIEEFDAQKDALVGRRVRVSGHVQKGTVDWDVGKLELRFGLGGPPEKADGTGRAPLPVEFKGIVPDMFGEGRGVIVEGVYRPDNTFAARTLLTSCPSKYEAKVPESGEARVE